MIKIYIYLKKKRKKCAEVLNTYDWIIGTADSWISITIYVIITIMKSYVDSNGPGFRNKVNNGCPVN